MHSLETNKALNAGVTVSGILERAKGRGAQLTRDEVLDELKFTEDEDTSQWSAMVDAMLAGECASQSVAA